MSKLTPSQHATLVWLEKIGGVCVVWRDKVRYPPDAEYAISKSEATRAAEARMMPAVSAVHLVLRGCIEARNGRLHITEYGRRMLK